MDLTLLSARDVRRLYLEACKKLDPEALQQSVHPHKRKRYVERWTAERDACAAELKRRGRA